MITEPPHICTATPPTANRQTPSASTRGTAPAGRGQAKVLKLGLPHAAVDATAAGMRAALRTGSYDRSDRHRHLDTGCILATAKVPSGSAANAMY